MFTKLYTQAVSSEHLTAPFIHEKIRLRGEVPGYSKSCLTPQPYEPGSALLPLQRDTHSSRPRKEVICVLAKSG